jgi:hypothetical protein
MSFRASTAGALLNLNCQRDRSLLYTITTLAYACKLALPDDLREYLQPDSPPERFPMERRTTSWYSQNLNAEMPLVAYGHAGPPLLMFPTAAADYLEYERFYLVDAIKQFIEAGKLRAYSINSVNRYSLLNEQMPPHLKAELLTRYDRYLTDEVLPLIATSAATAKAGP